MDPTPARIWSATAKLRLTAVITNYNHGHYLPVAVEAMVKQSRPADELILIDDASTDGSHRVVDELARRYPFIKIVKHVVNRGVVLSVQEALDMATGDYFYAGAADDMVLPDFFESTMSLLERFPTAPICAGAPVYWNEETDQQFEGCVGLPREAGFLTPPRLWSLARQGVLGLGGSSALCRVVDLKALGGFRPALKWHVDFFLAYSLALGGGLAWTARSTAVFRISPKSYSSIRFDRPREEQLVLAELARLVATEMPVEIQNGFRASGILGRLAWPMASALLSERRYWSQLSPSFWRVCLTLVAYRTLSPTVRAMVPKVLRRSMVQTTRSDTKFDLSAMKLRKAT